MSSSEPIKKFGLVKNASSFIARSIPSPQAPVVGRIKPKKEFMYREDWPNFEDMSVADDPPDPQRSVFMELVLELRTVKNPFTGGKVRLPTSHELAQLPEHLQRHFHQLAIETLRTYLYPRLQYHLKHESRARLVANQLPFIPQITAMTLKKYALFAAWPEDVLKLVAASLHSHCVERGEFILHEDEKVGSGIYFVVSGTMHQLKKKSRASKSIGYDKCDVVASTMAPALFGEFSFLTEEPRLVSVRALSACSIWILSKKEFHHHLNMLPKDTYGAIIAVAFTKRNLAMVNNYPMTLALLECHAIFSKCNRDVLQDIINKLEPYAVPKQFVLCKADETARYMYFVRHGKCGTYRTMPSGEEIHIGTLEPGALSGDSALLHASNNDLTIRTLTNCDTWRLSKLSFDAVVRAHPFQYNHMMESARLKRQEELSAQQSRYRDAMLRIPLLSSYVSKYNLGKELLALFTPYVHKPMQLLCATSMFCDRMIILLKGKVRVGKDMALTAGECIGFTCVVPHRWAQIALTLDIVEVLELKRDAYRDFLSQYNLLHEMTRDVKQLLFPRAFPKSVVVALHASIGVSRSPIMYPVSHNDEVKMTEHGFLMEIPEFAGKPPKDAMTHFWEQTTTKARAQTPSKGNNSKEDDGPAPPWESVKGTWRKATRHLWLPNLKIGMKGNKK